MPGLPKPLLGDDMTPDNYDQLHQQGSRPAIGSTGQSDALASGPSGTDARGTTGATGAR